MQPSALIIQHVSTFTDYFKLNLDIEDVTAYFGYTFQSSYVELPRTLQPIPWVADLRERIQTSLPYISLTSEIARREFLIAPVLLDMARYTQAKIKVEFLLDVSDKLRGSVDYFIQARHTLLVIEAKNADLQRGFTQLTAELIALDQWLETTPATLYGAVSIGNIWQFGLLNPTEKRVTQDLNLYRVPADLEDLLRILVAIITENGAAGHSRG